MTTLAVDLPSTLAPGVHAVDDVLERSVLEAAPDGIMVTDRAGRILRVNQAMEAICGYRSAQLCGQSVEVLVPPSARKRYMEQVRLAQEQQANHRMGVDRNMWLLRQDGALLPVDVALGFSDVQGGTVVAYVRDMTELRRLEARIHYQATHDMLTGLPNRWRFYQRLEQAVNEVTLNGAQFSLLLLDLDDFKHVNDGYGHPAGDQALIGVAHRLRAMLRPGDMLARLGGDEFTVLLPGTADTQEVSRVAERLLQSLRKPFQVDAFDVGLGASMGIVQVPAHSGDAATLMRYADLAMYQAKRQGHYGYVFYAAQLGERAQERLRVHERLRLALQEERLKLHFQPQVEVASGRVVSVEALLRWNDPVLGGDVAPERCIPIAEATGLILPLGAWVLDAACRQIAAWMADGLHLRVAINVSVQQLRQPGWVAQVARVLQAHGAPPHLLEIEITESEAMNDRDFAVDVLQALRALGVQVSLDDFGTGYSSLAYLRQLPVTRVKLDRAFMRNTPEVPADTVLARAVIAMAHGLGLEVVAEGVERSDQLAFLRGTSCALYQGWLASKALSAEALAQWLAHGAQADTALPALASSAA